MPSPSAHAGASIDAYLDAVVSRLLGGASPDGGEMRSAPVPGFPVAAICAKPEPVRQNVPVRQLLDPPARLQAHDIDREHSSRDEVALQ